MAYTSTRRHSPNDIHGQDVMLYVDGSDAPDDACHSYHIYSPKVMDMETLVTYIARVTPKLAYISFFSKETSPKFHYWAIYRDATSNISLERLDYMAGHETMKDLGI